jgi:hypothetical protein
MKTTPPPKTKNSLLKTQNLSHTGNFATRTQNDSSTRIVNTVVDNVRLSSSSTFPIKNGLSDYDPRFLTINNTVTTNTVPLKQRTRKIN